MATPLVLGIDTGLTGALMLLDTRTNHLVERDMPVLSLKVGRSAARTVLDDRTLANMIRLMSPDHAIVEEVGGITGQSASASFTFGAGYGVVRGIIAALGISATFIKPVTWQTASRVPAGKDGSRQRAMQLYPAQADLFARVKDHGRADAALIARVPWWTLNRADLF